MRTHFNDLFIIENNMMTAKQGLTIRIGSMTMEHNAWYAAAGGVIVGGVDMSKLVGKELEVDFEYGIHVVKRVYPLKKTEMKPLVDWTSLRLSPSRGGPGRGSYGYKFPLPAIRCSIPF